VTSLLERGALALAGALSLAVLGGWLAGLGLVASPTKPLAVAGWLADTLCNFQLAYALGFIPALAVLALRRRWRSLAAFAPFAASVVLALWPYLAPDLAVTRVAAASSQTANAPAQELRIAALNVWFRNPHPRIVRQWIADTDADIVVLSEITPELHRALAPALVGYPYQAMSQGETRADVLFASRVPLTFVPLADPDAGDYMVAAHVCPAQDRCAWVIGAHVPSPVSPGRLMHRDRLLAEIGDLAAAHRGEPVIVAGDLNSTPWVPGFRTMVAQGGLADSARGHFIWPTWNTRLFVAQIPIDHVLVGGPVAVLDRAVGSDVGSDHLPVTARLRF
jgi:endonuclease/exonuclease/phosphatase (EEP) superfamily protein YafD